MQMIECLLLIILLNLVIFGTVLSTCIVFFFYRQHRRNIEMQRLSTANQPIFPATTKLIIHHFSSTISSGHHQVLYTPPSLFTTFYLMANEIPTSPEINVPRSGVARDFYGLHSQNLSPRPNTRTRVDEGGRTRFTWSPRQNLSSPSTDTRMNAGEENRTRFHMVSSSKPIPPTEHKNERKLIMIQNGSTFGRENGLPGEE